MATKNRDGGYYRPHPLDFELLRRMPKEGSQLGYHTLAMTVAHVRKELNKSAPPGGELTSAEITARLHSMKAVGFAIPVQVLASRGAIGWQRTAAGERHYLKETGEAIEDAPTSLTMIEGGKP